MAVGALESFVSLLVSSLACLRMLVEPFLYEVTVMFGQLVMIAQMQISPHATSVSLGRSSYCILARISI